MSADKSDRQREGAQGTTSEAHGGQPEEAEDAEKLLLLSACGVVD